MPKISIIVPVYRAEAVLPTCVESVFAQTFQDWELLLVDDGSPDKSGRLCDEYAARDPRVRVFHKGNGGVSSARNLGMREARGEYLFFIDADDWIAPETCQTLLDALEGAGADSAGCAHWNITPDGQKWAEPGALPAGTYDREAIRAGVVDRLLGRRLGKPGEVLNGFIWRFLFSRDIIARHELRFSGAYLEDELFLMEYFCLAERLVVLDEPLTAEINGRTVSVKALLRGENTLRVLYDVDNAQGMEPNDLVWDTGAFYLRAADNSGDKRLYIASNAQVGPCYGYAIGSWATRNAVSEGGVLSCYVDIPLTQTATDTRTLYICDLTNHKASAHVKVMLPDMAEAVTINVKKTIALKGGHWFHYDMTEEEAEQYPDATFDIQEVRIEPLAVSVIGKNHGSLPLGDTHRYDVQSRVKLFRADGTELTYGWDGEFYQGFYGRVSKSSGQSALRVNTYSLIDPEAVAYVEIDGERFEVK